MVREETEVHALVFTVVQIYSACWIIAQTYPDYAGRKVDKFEKNGMCSQVQWSNGTNVKSDLIFHGSENSERNFQKMTVLSFNFRKITGGTIGTDLSRGCQEKHIIGVRKAQIDFEGVDAQYQSEILVYS